MHSAEHLEPPLDAPHGLLMQVNSFFMHNGLCLEKNVYLFSPSYAHRLILMSHTLCIQDTPDTAVAPLPHTGDTELTTPQADIADRDEAETTTVCSVHTIVL